MCLESGELSSCPSNDVFPVVPCTALLCWLPCTGAQGGEEVQLNFNSFVIFITQSGLFYCKPLKSTEASLVQSEKVRLGHNHINVHLGLDSAYLPSNDQLRLAPSTSTDVSWGHFRNCEKRCRRWMWQLGNQKSVLKWNRPTQQQDSAGLPLLGNRNAIRKWLICCCKQHIKSMSIIVY